jgi:peptide/nickel transport system permease protein
MINYLLRRILITLPVIFGVVTLAFMLIHFVPGDPAEIMLGEQSSLADRQELKTRLGLDKPLSTQYIDYWGKLLRGDLGVSFFANKPVMTLIWDRLPATLELTVGAMIAAILIGVPLGVFSAIKQYGIADNAILVTGLLGISIPGVFLGPLLIYIFGVKLMWFPVSDRGGIENLILPAISLALPLSAILMRMTRAAMLDVIREDYIRTARAKGAAPMKVYFTHALRNALMPVITIVGLQIGSLLTGAVITETIFDWPGLGTLLFNSISQRDYPLVQACLLLTALIFIFVNFLTDLAYAWANPRVRLE